MEKEFTPVLNVKSGGKSNRSGLGTKMGRTGRFEREMLVLSTLSQKAQNLRKLITETNASYDNLKPILVKLRDAGAIREEMTIHGSSKRYRYSIRFWGREILTHYTEIIKMMKGEGFEAEEEPFKLGESYFIPLFDNRFHLSFRSDEDSTGEHTHVFLQKDIEKDEGIEVNEAFKIYYIFKYQKNPPIENLTDVVLQLGFSYETKEEWNNIFLEFLLHRKLDQKVIDEMGTWVEISLEDMDEITIVDEVTGEVLAE